MDGKCVMEIEDANAILDDVKEAQNRLGRIIETDDLDYAKAQAGDVRAILAKMEAFFGLRVGLQ